jgi:hypothetical protein
MIMKRCLILLILLMFSMVTFAKKLATLPDIFRPYHLSVDDQNFYVTEDTTIFIFSLKDFTLEKKFGKMGEGPREFKRPQGGSGIMTFPQTDSLVINSMGKVSFFTKEGNFVKEMKSPVSGQVMGMYQPIGKQFAGFALSIGKNQSMDITVNIYDANLKKVKQIHKQPFFQQGRMTFPIIPPVFYVSDNKIITIGQEEFGINIFDANGNKVTTITREYKLLKVTEDYKKGVFDSFKTNPDTKQFYEVFKNIIKFSDYFPGIQFFFVDNQKVYILTYLKKDETYEFFIYNFKGQFLKRLFLPVAYLDGLRPCPTYIKDNKLYQVIENEEEEVWELHAHPIE